MVFVLPGATRQHNSRGYLAVTQIFDPKDLQPVNGRFNRLM